MMHGESLGVFELGIELEYTKSIHATIGMPTLQHEIDIDTL